MKPSTTRTVPNRCGALGAIGAIAALIAACALAAPAAEDAARAPTTAPVPTAPAPVAPAGDEAEVRALHLIDAVRLSAAVAPVDIATLDRAIAQAGYGAQRMALLPDLSATAGAARFTRYQDDDGRARRFGPDTTWDARLRLSQALIDLESFSRTAAASRLVAAAEAAAHLALEDASSTAASAYVGLAVAQALVEVRQQDLRLAEQLSGEARARVDAGATESIAATRAASLVEASRSALVGAQGATRTAAIVLARALNLQPDLPLRAADGLGDDLVATSAPVDGRAAEDAARANRPELRVTAETLAAFEAERRAARYARLPRVDLFADAGRIGPASDDLVTTWQIGLQLTVPILDRRIYDDEIAVLRARQQRIRLLDLDDAIRAQVREALVALETARARVAADLDGQRLAEQEVSEARARFDAGAAGNLELIQAQQTFSIAQERLVSSREASARARVRLARSVGEATRLR